ncbi:MULTISPECIES: class II fructose-1,6-bisphosphate aldolase [Peribacillus]|uniref:class II fructose-1,6-bisphosphate aldolase n=1 Tax=Peribacillus TaxID=2675229 RepID=UPI00203FDF77|nr:MULTISPECIES: class II fructose-1,6-bisphosphate aldolase [Peribacillus]MCM3672386.1 class II fructose-1,6-bisphosphate aldolase [Peribacillus simplex]MDQ0881646.1 fructose-bisphosphate aldolase class II [Peribacillus sp. V2I11]
MELVTVKEMLIKALKEGYAVGHFDIHNLEWAQAVLGGAEEEKSPVILGVTEGAVRYLGGCSVAVAMVKALMNEMNITVPVALHLDHGSSVENCKAAIDAGFTSVMIDASRLPFAENVKLTEQVVEYAHERGVSVEAEVGSIGGKEDDAVSEGSIYADPKDCEMLVKLTGIDLLAPALGSVHGLYKGEPKLGFEEMKEISQTIGIPLVLHGASGLPTEQIKKSISLGTAKINVNADNHLAFTKTVRDILNQDSEVYDASKYISLGREAVKETVIGKIGLFGSSGKAL